MSDVVIEIIVILGLLVVNGLLAMSEMAVVTARRNRLERRAEGGDRRARAAMELASDPTHFLSTVQVGITLVGTLAGAFGGATISEQLAARLAVLPGIGEYAEGLALAIVVAAITYLSLIVGELVPKRLALANPENVARLIALPMRMLATVARPIVWVLAASSNLVLRLIPVRSGDTHRVTEEDIRALIAQGTTTGAVHEAEEEILGRVLALGDRPIGAIMTPRTELDWLRVAAPEAATELLRRPDGPSWFLVSEDAIDNVIGVVSATDLLLRFAATEPLDLRAMARPPAFAPETLSILKLMDVLVKSPVPVAVVLDEYGGVNGLVYFDQILRHLVTDLPGQTKADQNIVRREDGSWLVDGATPIGQLEEELNLPGSESHEWKSYRTAAGMVLAALGHLPRVGEQVVIRRFRFEVVDMDGRRIDRVLVNAPATTTPSHGA